MTNENLIKRWRTLSIQFKSNKTITPMMEMFLLCAGESEIDVEGKKESVISFYQGYDEKGSPVVFFTSDSKNNCWTYGYDSNKKTHVKSKIGKFIEMKK